MATLDEIDTRLIGLLREDASQPVAGVSAKEMLKYLGDIKNPEQLADLVSCAVLPDPRERQTILETVEVDSRLRRLIQFLMADLRRRRDNREE